MGHRVKHIIIDHKCYKILVVEKSLGRCAEHGEKRQHPYRFKEPRLDITDEVLHSLDDVKRDLNRLLDGG